MLQCFNASMLLRLMPQLFNASMLQCFNASILHRFSMSKLQNFNFSKLQRFQDQYFIVSGLNAVMFQCLNLQSSVLQSLAFHFLNTSILQHPCIKAIFLQMFEDTYLYRVHHFIIPHTHNLCALPKFVCVCVCYSACKGVWAGELGLQFNPIKLSGR